MALISGWVKSCIAMPSSIHALVVVSIRMNLSLQSATLGQTILKIMSGQITSIGTKEPCWRSLTQSWVTRIPNVKASSVESRLIRSTGDFDESMGKCLN
jgi:hypothetical protein